MMIDSDKQLLQRLEGILHKAKSVSLGKSISDLRQLLTDYHLGKEQAALELVADDYKLMCNYLLMGLVDDKREALYQQLYRKFQRIAGSLIIDIKVRNNITLNAFLKEATPNDFDLFAIPSTLEHFMQDMAMVGIEDSTTTNAQLEKKLYDYRRLYFRYISILRCIDDREAEMLVSLLVSPLYDYTDKRLVVSALILSLTIYHDHLKWIVLMKAALTSTDIQLSTISLIALILSANSECAAELQQLMSDAQIAARVVEMEKRMYFCRNVLKDSAVMEHEIMPEILKCSDIKFGVDGLLEQKESDIDEILNSSLLEEKQESLDKIYNTISSMQRAGRDIYFSGFKHSKYLSFFGEIINWFIPFYKEHPLLTIPTNNDIMSGIVDKISSTGRLCDSDMYSITITLQKFMLGKSGSEIKEVFSLPDMKRVGESKSPQSGYYFLHDLNRFFLLYRRNSDFSNPFSRGNIFLSLFSLDTKPDMRSVISIAKFYSQQGEHQETKDILRRYLSLFASSKEYQLLLAVAEIRTADYEEAIERLLPLHSAQAEDKTINKALAVSHYKQQRFAETLSYLQLLDEKEFAEQSNLMMKADCLSRTSKSSEAINLLSRQLYTLQATDDDTSKRETLYAALGYAYLVSGNLERSLDSFRHAEDYCHAHLTAGIHQALCQWFSGNLSEVTTSLRHLISQFDATSIITTLSNEEDLLASYGKTITDCLVLMDC